MTAKTTFIDETFVGEAHSGYWIRKQGLIQFLVRMRTENRRVVGFTLDYDKSDLVDVIIEDLQGGEDGKVDGEISGDL